MQKNFGSVEGKKPTVLTVTWIQAELDIKDGFDRIGKVVYDRCIFCFQFQQVVFGHVHTIQSYPNVEVYNEYFLQGQGDNLVAKCKNGDLSSGPQNPCKKLCVSRISALGRWKQEDLRSSLGRYSSQTAEIQIQSETMSQKMRQRAIEEDRQSLGST